MAIDLITVPSPACDIHCQHILLTGATGVLGSYLLSVLAEDQALKISCLVRCANEGRDAMSKILSMWASYHINHQALLDLGSRISFYIGDVSKKNLGLSDHDYSLLTSEVDVVIHAAAAVSLHGSLADIEAVNVNGTQHVIDFVLGTRSQYMVYVSSYSVMGSYQLDDNPPFYENQLDVGQNFDGLGYQQSKFESERFIRQVSDPDFKWVIVRPGNIFGESKAGCYPLQVQGTPDFFYDILKTIIEIKCSIRSRMYFDVTPVDYIAQAIYQLSVKRVYLYQTFHLNNPHSLRYGDLIALLNGLGHRIDFVTHHALLQQLKSGALRRNNKPYRSTTTAFLRHKPELFDTKGGTYADTTVTAHLLGQHGVFCPPVDAALLKKLIHHAQLVGFIHSE